MGRIDVKNLGYSALLIAALLFLLISLEKSTSLSSHCGLTPHPPPSALSLEEVEVKETILEVYRLMGFKGLAFDTSRLDEFFTDDTRFPLRNELQEQVELAFGEVPEGAGYLTYISAWYKNWERKGTPTLDEAWQQAKAAKCRYSGSSLAIYVEIIREKLERQPGVKSLEAQLGYYPVFRSPMENESIPEDWIERFHFLKFEIEGDKAICLYDDWGTVRSAYLVYKEDKWYIADNILLQVHP